jgi:hypothetical protein
MSPSAGYAIAGRTVTLPVQIREARQWATTWLVPASAAQAMIDYSGLEVAQPLPGKAIFSLAFVDYLDGDLDAYHEVAFSLVVRRHDAPPPASAWDHARAFRTGDTGAFIHDLPVDQEFTREAGTTIWGYPKWIADIELTPMNGATACTVSCEGRHQFTLWVRDRGLLPFPAQMPPTYSWREGVLRRTTWDLEVSGGTTRPGGARLSLGAAGPLVRTLRRLRLPRHALMSATAPRLSSTFGAPEVVDPTEEAAIDEHAENPA